MPKAARAEDEDTITTGHGCDGTAQIRGTEQNSVYINGILASVKGDIIAPHTILVGDVCVPHTAYVNEGSSTVFFENIPAARIGDSADGGQIITGSDNVFIGG